jgi:peptide deformylase
MELPAGLMITEDAAFRRSRIAVSSRRNGGAAMAVRTVRQLGDPVLREKCKEVQDASAPEIRALVDELQDTLAYWRKTTGYGRGIAAPQIGVLQRVIFLRLPGEDPWPLVNPRIVERSAERIVVWDACLSFLSIFMQVERNREITVQYQDLRGKTHEIKAGELRDLSELLQHEIDHLDGILCIDRVTDLKSVCTKEEFEKRYRAASPYAASASQ